MKDITDLYLASIDPNPADTSHQHIEDLLKWANAQKDTFSSCRLYSAASLQEVPITRESKVLEAIIVLLNSEVYTTEINEVIDRGRLLRLLEIITADVRTKTLRNKLVDKTNILMRRIQETLASHSETPAFPASFDIVDTMKRHLMVKRYYGIVKNSWSDTPIERKPLGQYFVRFTRKKYSSANRIKSVLSTSPSLSGVCSRTTAEEYIGDCRNNGVPESELYRAIFDIELSAVDETGSNLSGGQ
jgi:hypothetical protein